MDKETNKELKSIHRALDKIEQHLRQQKENDTSDNQPSYREDG